MVFLQITSIDGPALIFHGLDFILLLVKTLYLLIDRTRFNDFVNTNLGYQISKLIVQLLLAIRK